MNEELQNEVEAINSIYGDGTLVSASEDNIYVLRLPGRDASLRIQFPPEYPSVPPAVLGTQSSGEHTKKGEAAHVVGAFRDVLGRIYQPGEVCLFDAIEEANNSLTDDSEIRADDGELEDQSALKNSAVQQTLPASSHIDDFEPPWTLSEVVVELKSAFIARAAPVSSPEQAKQYLQRLLDSDKKLRSATHNITSWRIKGGSGVVYQDCDDDGETAAGGRLLHLMQLMDLWDVMVVVTRWYGGHQLGPKRFSIINQVAREAFVKGGFVREEVPTRRKGKH